MLTFTRARLTTTLWSALHGSVITGPGEGFEGTGAPALWTDTSTSGSVDWDYTTSPLYGSQSLFGADTSSGVREVTYNFPEDADEIWIALRFRMSADPAAAANWFITLLDSGTNVNCHLQIGSTGNLTGHVDTAASTVVRDIAAATTYRIKLRYKKGTGANEELEVWANSEASGTWGTSQVRTNGTTTTRADALILTNTNTGNHDVTWDTVLISTSDIPWSSLD
jgi:hypothetical protein